METKKQRAFGPDLVRSAAVLLVLSVHFFWFSGFYNQPLAGWGMYLSAWARMCCMSCVPLFMMLSGYLCIGKKWSPGYYRRLVPVLLSYVLAGAACLVFRVFYLKEALSGWEILHQFTGFGAAPYGWYIEMYIGLFLLIPFLNAAWNGVDGRGRTALLWTALAVSILPATVNSLAGLLPDWWVDIYPAAYYFLGAWLREHPLKVRGGWLLLGWLGAAGAGAVTAAVLTWPVTGSGLFPWLPATDFNSAFVAAGSVCLFSLLLRLGERTWPRPVRWAVSHLAAISLQVYLISYVSDSLLYPHLAAAGLPAGRRLLWMPVFVCSSALLSCVAGQLLNWLVAFLDGLGGRKKEAQGRADH